MFSRTADVAVLTFGRFQPPTIGHAELIGAVKRRGNELRADSYVFVSSKVNNMEKYLRSRRRVAMVNSGRFNSYEENENPLRADQKVRVLEKQYTGLGVRFIDTGTCGCRTVFEAVDKLLAAGYGRLVLLVGSDRVEAFSRMMKPIEAVTVEPAGEVRSAERLNVRGMSGTKMRRAAVAGDLDAFQAGVRFGSMTDADVLGLLNDIRVGLGYAALGRGGRRTRRRLPKCRGTRRK